MEKKQQQQIDAGSSSSRGASAVCQPPSTVTAGSKSGVKATSSQSDLDESGQQARSYLSLEELAAMKPTTRINVEMSLLAGQNFTLYTTASNMVMGVQCITSDDKSLGRKVLARMLKQLLKSAKEENPEELYHKMNSGTETDLLRWQQFSGLCFNIIFMQHVLQGVPFHAWIDDDMLAPGKRAARERARLTVVTGDMKSASLLKSNFSSTVKVSSEPAPILTELGDDDIVHVDMTELIGRNIAIAAPRTAVQDMFAHWHKYMVNPGAYEMAKRIYNQLLNDLKSGNLRTHEATLADSCVELAVLARLLYNKPIRVEKAAVPEGPNIIGDIKDGSRQASFITDPTPEMLHPITIPAAVADKGGYIIAGYFRPGMGIETVHLEFSDFKQDDDVMLNLSNQSDKYMLALRMSNKDFIEQVNSWKESVGGNMDVLKHIADNIHTLCELPDDPDFQHKIFTHDPATDKQLTKILQDRSCIPTMRQCVYGTPARLLYVSDHAYIGDDPKKTAYLERVREICVDKLNMTSGVWVIEL